MTDLENARPKDYAEGGDGINWNRGHAQQVRVGDNTPAWVLILAIVTAIVALIMASLGWWMVLKSFQDARDAINAAQAAELDGARSAERALVAELQNAMRDNETRYETHGCFLIIG